MSADTLIYRMLAVTMLVLGALPAVSQVEDLPITVREMLDKNNINYNVEDEKNS